jgi:hypothetical protein
MLYRLIKPLKTCSSTLISENCSIIDPRHIFKHFEQVFLDKNSKIAVKP